MTSKNERGIRMAFDGLFTSATVHDLQQLTNGRISKIHQPNTQEVLLIVRANQQNHKLLFSIHPSYARVQLTNDTQVNPPEPPMFCMVLRKHLEGGVILSITQEGADRIMKFTIRARNEIGDEIERHLIMEIMGRHSNLLLVAPEKTTIVDSMKHLPPSVNSYRTILPGQPYVSAPPQQKVNPFTLSKQEVEELLPKIETARDFVNELAGFSPVNANELFYRLQQVETDAQFNCWSEFLDAFRGGHCEPTISMANGKMIFSATALTYAERVEATCPNLASLLDKVYFGRAERERVRAQAADLERWLINEISKLELKMKKLKREQQAAEKLDTFQLYGELLTANSYAIEKGAIEVTVDNYYEEGQQVTIPLDPQKSAIDNAQRYYTRYTKAKNALTMIAEQLEKTAEDIQYFEMVLQQVMQASPEDIEEIREELMELGFMRARHRKKKQKSKRPSPEQYVSSTGIAISVGKNNKQNDYLTFKIASRQHVWLHTKDIPGSHVVIHHEAPDEQTLQEAAILAAYFSKARESSAVPVDYTEIRHVKKPNGSKPGFVIYFEQKTLFVNPEEDVVRALRK